MSRIFHRPMFRKGGSAGGITSGLRRGYAEGGYPNPELDVMEEQEVVQTPGGDDVMDKVEAAYRAFGAPTELPKSTAGSDFLMNLGLNLMSGPSTGSFWGNVGEAGKEPLGQFQKARAAEKAMKYKRGESERGLKFEIWKNLSKDEQDQYYTRAKMLVREGRAKNIGDALNILFPGTRKPAHEADIIRDEVTQLITDLRREDESLQLTQRQGKHILDAKNKALDNGWKTVNDSRIIINEEGWKDEAGKNIWPGENEDGVILFSSAKHADKYIDGFVYVDITTGKTYKKQDNKLINTDLLPKK